MTTNAPRHGLRRCAIVLVTILAVAAAAFWPFTHRYTSFGLDLERANGDVVECSYWRLRWPGDGSFALCHETATRANDGRPVVAWDLGGRFLEPAPRLVAESFWARHGFWWIRHETAAGPAPPIVAGSTTAHLVAVPHWLVLAALAVIAAVAFRRRPAPAAM